MIHFKNRRGFTLIEAMVAVAIAAIILTPLFILQGVVLQNVGRMSRTLHRIFWAQHFLYEARRIKDPEVRDFTLEKKIEDPECVLKYELKAVAKKSSLSQIADIRKEQVTITWQDQRRTREEQIISFVYKPESPPKKI